MIPPSKVSEYLGQGFRFKGVQATVEGKKETTAATLASQERRTEAQIGSRKDLIAAQTELAQWRTQAIKEGLDPNSPVFQQKERALQSRIEMAQQGLALREKSLELAIERMYRPTTAARDRASFAESLREHIPDIKEQIDTLDRQGKLGAIAGRWNEFMTGTVGADDPDIAQLRTSIGLIQTGMMVPHVGARGGVQLIKKFEGLVNSGRMSAGNMKAALGEMDKFLEGYARLPEVQVAQSRKLRGESAPSGKGKVADDATLQKYLDAAGGNKAKARAALLADGWKIGN